MPIKHIRNKWKWIVAGVVMLYVVLVIAIILTQRPVTISLTTNDYTSIAGRPPELPNVVPVDFPVYPDVVTIRMAAKPPDLLGVGFGSNDPPSTVFDYLITNAEESGWMIEEQSELKFRARKQTTVVIITISQNSGEQTAILEQVQFNVF